MSCFAWALVTWGRVGGERRQRGSGAGRTSHSEVAAAGAAGGARLGGGGGSVLRQPLLSPPPTSRFPSSLSSSGPFFSLAVSLFLPSSKDICRTPEEPGVYPRAPLCLPSPTCCSAHSSLRLCLSSSSSSSFYLRVPGSFPLHLRLAPSFPVTLTSTQLLAALATHLARGLAPPPPRPR